MAPATPLATASAIATASFLIFRSLTCESSPVARRRKEQTGAPASFRLDVSCLDDRPPLLDLGLVKSAQRLRRLLLARRDHVTELGEPLPHPWIRQGIHHRRVELADDVRGRAPGDPQAIPERDV